MGFNVSTPKVTETIRKHLSLLVNKINKNAFMLNKLIPVSPRLLENSAKIIGANSLLLNVKDKTEFL